MSQPANEGTTCEDGRLVVATGDITKMLVDAVVNAANSSLMGGGGVDGAIHRAGGPAILEECRRIRADRYPDGVPPGDAVITTAGELPAGFVIHTVGPVWSGGKADEPATLARAYGSCLKLAADNALGSIAFPAISTGVYGYPKDLAAVIAYKTIADFVGSHDSPKTVCLVFFSRGDTDIFLKTVPCH